MTKKKIIILGVVALAVIIIGYALYSKHSKDVPVNIIGSEQKIKLQDIKMFFKGFPAQTINEDPRKYFSEEIINVYTVRFFKFIETQIEFTNREQHLKAVKAYLNTVLDPQRADEMFVLYEKFLDYDISLQEKTKSWGQPKTAEELLKYLQVIQDYRREVFGAEIADAMWGAEVKFNEYIIRKNSIKLDQNMYGAEKEKKIAALKEDMWGTKAASIEDPPQTDPEKFSSYQEKQAIYQKDLQELPEDQRMEKIKEFRKDYFSSEQIARLEQVDKELASDKKKESDYYAQEKEIINNPAIADDKKAELIRELQNDTFGEEAEAFRRRLNIEKSIK